MRVFLSMNDYYLRVISLMANAIAECSVVVYDHYIAPKDVVFVKHRFVENKEKEF